MPNIITEFAADPVLASKMRALKKSGSDTTREAARKLLRGERPTDLEIRSLFEYLTRGNNPRALSRDNHSDRFAAA